MKREKVWIEREVGVGGEGGGGGPGVRGYVVLWRSRGTGIEGCTLISV